MKKNPCTECPFRKSSLAGWLGDASGDPERFIAPMEYNIIPCHMKVKCDEEESRKLIVEGEINPCVGALQFCHNSVKYPRGARSPGPYKALYDQAKPNEDVFKWQHEFVKHHSQKP